MSPCVFSILVILLLVMAVEMSTLEGKQILEALHCPPCERIHCSPRGALKLQCKGGISSGICGCCPACPKLSGESCGGTWDYLGKCDEGLLCIYPEETDGKPEAQTQGNLQIRSVSLEKRDCGGHCQHTTCSSCLLLRPPSCPQSCSPRTPTRLPSEPTE